MENKKEVLVKDSVNDFDSALGSLLINVESLKAINTEVGHVREDVDNTDKSDLTSMALRFRDIDHKIILIDDLLNYTLKDLIKNYEECQHIKTGLFLEFIKEKDCVIEEDGKKS